MSDLQYKQVLLIDDNEVAMIPYVLPATTSQLGVMKPDGVTCTVDASGTLSSNYEIPVATDTTLGGVKIGTGITYTEGTISVPKATGYSLGSVKPDNTTIFIDGNGTISSSGGISALELLKLMYPIGAIFISTTATCPMSLIIPESTWELVAEGRCLQGSDANHQPNTTIPASSPNITGKFGVVASGSNAGWNTKVKNTTDSAGAFYKVKGIGDGGDASADSNSGFGFSAARSSSMYNGTTIQPSAYVVNIWRRTA